MTVRPQRCSLGAHSREAGQGVGGTCHCIMNIFLVLEVNSSKGVFLGKNPGLSHNPSKLWIVHIKNFAGKAVTKAGASRIRF